MQAKETYKAGDPVTEKLGSGLTFHFRPLVRLQNITTFDLDDSKCRPLIFSIGYRYLPYPRLRRPTACNPSLPSTFRCQESGSCSPIATAPTLTGRVAPSLGITEIACT
jgi:hypothetical protein